MTDIAKKKKDELQKSLIDYKKELMNLRFQKTLGELKNTSRFKIVRKEIAKIKTEINSRTKEAKNA